MSTITRWWDEGACRDLGDLMFPYSEAGGFELRLAKKTCTGCPVADECLADALDRDDGFGVRGGLSTPERQAHAAGAPIRTCGGCGLPYAALRDRGRCHDCTPSTRPRQRPAAVADPTADPRCGTRAGQEAHRRRGERSCQPCRKAPRDRSPRPVVVRVSRYDQHNVDMAVAGDPPAVLTSAERRAVCAALVAGIRLPRREMARLMRCTVRSADRHVAALRRQAAVAQTALLEQG